MLITRGCVLVISFDRVHMRVRHYIIQPAPSDGKKP